MDRRAASRAVLSADRRGQATQAERPLATSHRLPILTYHSLDASGSPISVRPELFAEQMQRLRAAGWRTASLGELLVGRAGGGWPARTVVLTFDDGFGNFLECALPQLVENGFQAIIFVVAGYLGTSNRWPGGRYRVPELDMMGASELRTAAEAGMEVGSHSLTHPHLPRLPERQAGQEIVESRSKLEDVIGHPIRAFAYPYGEASAAVEAVVGENYHAGFGTRLAFAAPGNRVTCFDRIDAYYLQARPFFEALESGWLASYLALRRQLRRVRNGFG